MTKDRVGGDWIVDYHSQNTVQYLYARLFEDMPAPQPPSSSSSSSSTKQPVTSRQLRARWIFLLGKLATEEFIKECYTYVEEGKPYKVRDHFLQLGRLISSLLYFMQRKPRTSYENDPDKLELIEWMREYLYQLGQPGFTDRLDYRLQAAKFYDPATEF
jgi:hypothetical protein